MRKTEERMINGVTYSVAQFIPTEALKYQLVLTKLISKPLAGLYSTADLGALKKMKDDNEATSFIDAGIDFEAGISQLADAIDPEKHTKFIKNMLRHVTADGIAVANQFDNVFMGKVMDIYRVLMFVIEVNYPDFFSPILGILDKLPESEPSESQENMATLEAV